MKELDPTEDSKLMKSMDVSLSNRQRFEIYAYEEREKRAQMFIETLAREMSTCAFIDFLLGLDKPEVRKEILDAYMAEGGHCHKCSKSSPCC